MHRGEVLERIGFGGGCHWCTEAIFQALRGVHQVEQGFIRSIPPQQSWSEAVIVQFDTAVIDLPTLIEVHVRTHSATSNHSMRRKYRSAVYTFSGEQAADAHFALKRLQRDFEAPIVTRVLAFEDFRPSDARFQSYYVTNPERPFCKTYIEPKLADIRRRFAAYSAPSDA